MSVEVLSLGCRLNLAESEVLRGLLAACGDDVVVVNSCAVTAEAVRQTRQAIRRARRAHPDARLLVTGCAAEIEREALAAMPEVDGLVGNAVKLEAGTWAAFNGPNSAPVPFRGGAGGGVSPPDAAPLHTRAFLQVQNGCDHACSFCVIPQGRGPSRSRIFAELLNDVARQLDAGVRELVLTGVDLTAWGLDLPGAPRLGALVAAILTAFPALERLRLSSLDGVEIDSELFELIAGEPRVMPHVHLSLQAGDDLILKRMKRRHSRAGAVQLVEKLRARRPGIAIGADLIAGFPTEDEAMHARSLGLVAELGMVHGHVFPYSLRPGTPAARMPQVAPARVRARASELREAVAAVRQDWLHDQLGTPLRVLAERDGTGHAENFARVLLPKDTRAGTIVTIVPTRIDQGTLA